MYSIFSTNNTKGNFKLQHNSYLHCNTRQNVLKTGYIWNFIQKEIAKMFFFLTPVKIKS